MNFQADGVQGVLFLAPGQQQDDAIQLWSAIFPGDTPDGFQRAIASPALVSTATGEREGFHVAINSQVGRVDLIVNQAPSAVSASVSTPRISDVKAAAELAASLMKRACAQAEMARAAIVLDLAATVSHGSESSVLLEILDKFPFPQNSTDIAMQFNVRRPSITVEELALNRLCSWNSGQVAFIQNQAIAGGGLMVMSPFVGLKIDVNSAPEFRLAKEHLPAIIDEIRDEALAISTEGLARFNI